MVTKAGVHHRSYIVCNAPSTCVQKNFGRPVEYALVKEYPWSTPQLRRLDKPVSVIMLGGVLQPQCAELAELS